jgi:hypothetical protein
MTDASANDPFEMMRKMWAPMGMPGPGMMLPTMNVQEIEKRIADLRSVENWLTLNLNILRMTIQGMEMQKATLAAMTAMQPGAGKPGEANPMQSAAEAWWSMFQQAAAPAASPEKKPR